MRARFQKTGIAIRRLTGVTHWHCGHAGIALPVMVLRSPGAPCGAPPAGLIVESGRLVRNGQHHGCPDPFGPALRPDVEALPLQLGQVRQA